jgi:hypothetical protein
LFTHLFVQDQLNIIHDFYLMILIGFSFTVNNEFEREMRLKVYPMFDSCMTFPKKFSFEF